MELKLPINITHKNFGPGQIINITLRDEENILVDVIFDSGAKKLMDLNYMLERDFLAAEDSIMADLRAFNEEHMIIVNATIEKKEQEAQKQVELRQQELEKEREEKKYKLKVDRALKKLDTIRPENLNDDELIEWMAKHTVSITPTIPDYAKKWFTQRFGTPENLRVIDSKKKTSGGYSMIWGLQFRINFDQEVPTRLLDKTSTNKKSINSVSFVWTLIEKYGFKFGGRQDVDEILENT